MASLHSQPSNVVPLRAPGRRTPLRGTVLLGRYRLDAERARTKTGVVHEAFDLPDKKRVSVEVGLLLEPGAAQGRFVREAMVAQRLEGDRVLRVLDTGRLPDGAPFVVREAAVTTLARELEARGTMPVAEAVGFVLDAAEAVAEGHALGLSHGRVSLDTILLARDETDSDLRAKVAWTSSVDAATRDDEHSFMRDVADLGRTLAALTSGSGDDGASTLPAGLASVVARAITVGPGRFANVGELAAALASFAPDGHKSARNIACLLARASRPLPRAVQERRPPLRLAHATPPEREGWETSPGLAPVRPRPARGTIPSLRALATVVFLLFVGTVVAIFVARVAGQRPVPGAQVEPVPGEPSQGSPTTSLADDVTVEGLRARSLLPAYAKEHVAPRSVVEPLRPVPDARPGVPQERVAPSEVVPEVDDAEPTLEEEPEVGSLGIPI